MKIIKYPGREEWSSLIKRPALDVTTLFDTVRTVLDKVREQGDTAVKAYEEKFDKVLLPFKSRKRRCGKRMPWSLRT